MPIVSASRGPYRATTCVRQQSSQPRGSARLHANSLLSGNLTGNFAELGKRPFLARGLGFGAYWLPVPRQEFVEAAGGMTVGHALQDVSEPGKGLDVVELCGGDEGADGCRPDATKSIPVNGFRFPCCGVSVHSLHVA